MARSACLTACRSTRSLARRASRQPVYCRTSMACVVQTHAARCCRCERYVATGDDNAAVRLLHYPSVVANAPALRLGGHSSFVMGVQWAADSSFLVTAGGHDATLIQWRVSLPPLEGAVTAPAASDQARPVTLGGHLLRQPHSLPERTVSVAPPNEPWTEACVADDQSNHLQRTFYSKRVCIYLMWY
jgi:hypothetical protein